METTMRKLFLIAAVFLSATAAHAGADLTVADAQVQQAAASSTPVPDSGAVAAKRQAMIQQKMAMQKQMAMRREMQRHPIRTRLHFALLRLKQRLHRYY
jgi:hypothetical protein